MSAADADVYVDEVVASHGGELQRDDMVAFVDFHEERARKGTSFVAALQSLDCVAVNCRIIVGTLTTADVIICRVLAAEQTPEELAATRALEANVSIRGGLTPSALLKDTAATVLAPLMAYERKTATDLVSSVHSISDVPAEAHFHKQLAEMTEFCSVTGARPGLLLEGYMVHALTGEAISSMTEPEAHAVLVHAYVARGFPPWQSANVFDSARHVLQVAKLLVKYDVRPGSWVRLPRGKGDPEIRVRKARNADVQRYFVNILQAMDGMSAGRAQVICQRFHTIPALVAALDAAPSRKAQLALVADLTVNNRRLGNALADRVIARFASPMSANLETAAPAAAATKKRAADDAPTSSSSSSSAKRPTRRAAIAARTNIAKELERDREKNAVAATLAEEDDESFTKDDDDDDDDDESSSSDDDDDDAT